MAQPGRRQGIVGRDEEFIRDWTMNLPRQEMAKKYNVSVTAVTNQAKRLGLASRPNRRNAK
jgi:hypothetical protein